MSDIDFSKLTDEERAQLDKAVALADGIKLYRNAGGKGIGGSFAPHANQLARDGGMEPERATHIARYRQWKQTTGADPSWQGPINMNAGAPEPVDTDEQTQKRQKEYFTASAAGNDEELARVVRDNASRIQRSQEHLYDALIGEGPKPVAAPPGEALDKAKEFVKRNGRRGGKPMSMSDGDVLSKSMGRG